MWPFKKRVVVVKDFCTCLAEGKSVTSSKVYAFDPCLLKGGHTNFQLCRCKRCKGWFGFPNYNLHLALTEGSDVTLSQLRTIGVNVAAYRGECKT